MAEKQKLKKSQKIITIIEVVMVIVCLVVSILVITNSNKIDESGKGSYAKFLTVHSDSMTPTIGVNSVIVTEKPTISDNTDHYDLGTIVTFVATQDGMAFFDTHRIVGYRYAIAGDNTNVYYYVKGEQETFADFTEDNPTATFLGYITRGDKYTLENCGDVNGYQGKDFGKDKDGNAIAITGGENDLITKQNHDIVAIYDSQIKGIGGILKFFSSTLGFILCVIVPLLALLVFNIVDVVKVIMKVKVEKVRAESTIDELATKRKAIEEYLISIGVAPEEAKAKALEQVPVPADLTVIAGVSDSGADADNTTAEDAGADVNTDAGADVNADTPATDTATAE